MIVGGIAELLLYKSVIPFSDEIVKIRTAAELPPIGEWYSISDQLKVIRLDDWNRANNALEAHRKYFDLHMTLRGIDKLSVCMGRGHAEVVQEYDNEKDYSLYKGKVSIEVCLETDQWAFIGPEEPHRNEFLENETEKLVFKILINNV